MVFGYLRIIIVYFAEFEQYFSKKKRLQCSFHKAFTFLESKQTPFPFFYHQERRSVHLQFRLIGDFRHIKRHAHSIEHQRHV